MSVEAVDLVVLAGGGARRFGADKASALWRGRPLVEHVLAARPERPGRTVLVLGADGAAPTDAADTVVRDDTTLPPGPLRGIVAGLRACVARRAWVAACDLPGLRPAVLDLLLSEAREDDDAVVPEWGGRPQPLCALYASSATAALESAARDGVPSLIDALARLNVRRVPESKLRAVDSGASFVNVNRPDDLRALEASS